MFGTVVRGFPHWGCGARFESAGAVTGSFGESPKDAGGARGYWETTKKPRHHPPRAPHPRRPPTSQLLRGSRGEPGVCGKQVWTALTTTQACRSSKHQTRGFCREKSKHFECFAECYAKSLLPCIMPLHVAFPREPFVPAGPLYHLTSPITSPRWV